MREPNRTVRPSTARILAAVFLLAGILLGVFVAPTQFNTLLESAGIGDAAARIPEYRFGLDIKGGAHLVYQADLSGVSTPEYGDAMESLRDVIERRVNLFGVAEPVVQVERSGTDHRLIVELAGVPDIGAAIRMIGETPYLEFKEERPAEDRDAVLEDQKTNGPRAGEDPYFTTTKLTGRYLERAEVDFDPTTFQPEVILDLTKEGGEIFADLTKRNVGKQIAIYLDGAPISAPVVREEIAEGRAVISGNFTPQSAKELAGRLNAGALPVPIHLISQETVGASLGEESFARSLNAGIIGFLFVAIFMIAWYRLPGILAVFALCLYTLALLSLFKLIPVTLTIAGIAGFILSIGMAVDANILIFERMKEELRAGRTLDAAIYEGFSRAWTSIRDSNVSSLITSVILYWFGTSIVQGFALTLSLGILVSMVSAISVTRTLLIAVLNRRVEKMRVLFLSGITR